MILEPKEDEAEEKKRQEETDELFKRREKYEKKERIKYIIEMILAWAGIGVLFLGVKYEWLGKILLHIYFVMIAIAVGYLVITIIGSIIIDIKDRIQGKHKGGSSHHSSIISLSGDRGDYH